MGVYVKGMEMPESCRECPFTYWDGVTGERWCDRIIAPCNKVDCPLVEVPTPHGRLVDANELCKKIERKTAEPDYQHTSEDWKVGLYIGEDLVYDAPTVIEAEGE